MKLGLDILGTAWVIAGAWLTMAASAILSRRQWGDALGLLVLAGVLFAAGVGALAWAGTP